MSELLNVAAALSRTALAGQTSVLATVVRTEGATYRRIGARMAALPDGAHVGEVSAGCIEADVLLRAEPVRARGLAELVTYDTRSPDDLIWGSGAGCGGLTELLLEPLDPVRALAKAEQLRLVAEWRRPGILVTVIRAAGFELSAGDQATLPHEGAELSGFELVSAPFRGIIDVTAREALRVGASVAVRHVWGTQELDLAYEVRSPRICLSVCGAGPDAVPLVAMARQLGWQVTLIDHRPALLSSERWPEVDCVLIESPSEIAAAVERADCDAAVIMNHHFERDLGSLAACLETAIPFIGVLGPRRRTGLMVDRLEARGSVPEDAAQRIHSPVGLDLGAETAEEIALSIVAEIKACVSGRSGLPLRSRRAQGEKPPVSAVR